MDFSRVISQTYFFQNNRLSMIYFASEFLVDSIGF